MEYSDNYRLIEAELLVDIDVHLTDIKDIILSNDFYHFLLNESFFTRKEIADKKIKFTLDETNKVECYKIVWEVKSVEPDCSESIESASETVDDSAPESVDESAPELVNHPKHYGGDTEYECIKVLKAWNTPEEFIGFCKDNAIKYLCRSGKKDELVQEIKKAAWYCNELIDYLESSD